MKLMKRLRAVLAFTLIELLVVVAIIGLLAAILIPVIASAMDNALRAEASSDIQRLHLIWDAYKLEKGIYPAEQSDASPYVSGDAGLMTYDYKKTAAGVLNNIVEAYDYPISGDRVDVDNHYIDQWGEPIHYILGNYANRYAQSALDPTTNTPQDTNKPMGAPATDIAADSDWNAANKGGYPYIFSYGSGDTTYDADLWIYLKR